MHAERATAREGPWRTRFEPAVAPVAPPPSCDRQILGCSTASYPFGLSARPRLQIPAPSECRRRHPSGRALLRSRYQVAVVGHNLTIGDEGGGGVAERRQAEDIHGASRCSLIGASRPQMPKPRRLLLHSHGSAKPSSRYHWATSAKEWQWAIRGAEDVQKGQGSFASLQSRVTPHAGGIEHPAEHLERAGHGIGDASEAVRRDTASAAADEVDGKGDQSLIAVEPYIQCPSGAQKGPQRLESPVSGV